MTTSLEESDLPDYRIRLKAAELAGKWTGREVKTQVTVNIDATKSYEEMKGKDKAEIQRDLLGMIEQATFEVVQGESGIAENDSE